MPMPTFKLNARASLLACICFFCLCFCVINLTQQVTVAFQLQRQRPFPFIAKFALAPRVTAICMQGSESRSVPVPVVSNKLKSALLSLALLTSSGMSGFGAFAPAPAHAGIFDSFEQNTITEIALYQRPVFDLLGALTPSSIPNAIGVYSQSQLLKGGKDDSIVVYNYKETYFNPLQQKMESIAPKLKLSTEADQQRVSLLPKLMKGHLLELQMAIDKQSAEDQGREVQEIQETLGEFLGLAAQNNYRVDIIKPPNPKPTAEEVEAQEAALLGPFGCEFWGQRRMEGSNKCVDPAESTAK